MDCVNNVRDNLAISWNDNPHWLIRKESFQWNNRIKKLEKRNCSPPKRNGNGRKSYPLRRQISFIAGQMSSSKKQPNSLQQLLFVINNIYHIQYMRKRILKKTKIKTLSFFWCPRPMNCEKIWKAIIKTYHNNQNVVFKDMNCGCRIADSQTTLGAMAQLSCINHIMFMHIVHSSVFCWFYHSFCFYSIFKTLFIGSD